MPPTDDKPTAAVGASYAVFLSYNGDDRKSVEQLAVYLDDQAQLRPWFDQWSLVPGEPWVRMLGRGLKESGSCAVFVGRNGQGPWQKPEVESALSQQVSRAGFRVIPVLLPEANDEPELPDFLVGNTWVDFRGLSLEDDDSLWRLECGIRGVAPGRGRPRPPEPEKKAEAAAAATVAVAAVEAAAASVDVRRVARPASVFVSYRHQEPDQTVAHALAASLREAGHKVFIDTGIRWGENWVREISQHLAGADYFLLLLSRESAASEMVVEELTIARELSKAKGAPTILPLRVGLTFEEPLPYLVSTYLRSIQQEQWARPEDTARVIKRLLGAVGGGPWAGAGVSVEHAPAELHEDEAVAAAPQSGPALLSPQVDPREMIVPGGALDTNSRFYVVRQADEDVFDQVRRDRGIVTVRGPRQTGKTSLMMGTYAALRVAGGQLRTAFVDLQAFTHEDFHSLSNLWHAVADHVARQLRLKWDTACWGPGADHDMAFSDFLQDCVFSADERPLLVCLDEADRALHSPLRGDFFSSLRSLYNSGAYDPVARKVRWLLGTSSEPSFFIEDLTQSPFNVGLRVDLDAFTREEVDALARRHGLSLEGPALDRVLDYVGGRPYLSHLLFYHTARRPDDAERLFDPYTAGGGVFRDHLHRFLLHFHRDQTLAEAMRRVTRGEGCEDVRLADRLEAGGLVRRDRDWKVIPQCRLYADFFRRELKADG